MDFRNIDPSADIDPTVSVAAFATIGEAAVIKGYNSSVGGFSTIENNVVIKSCEIGNFVHIGQYSNIERSVIRIKAVIGQNNRISSGCLIDEHASTENTVQLYENVTVSSHAHIGANSKIGANSIIDEHSVIGSNSFVEPWGYVGEHVQLSTNVVVAVSAILEKFSNVAANRVVKFGAVVIPAPTSSSLYSDSAPFNEISQSEWVKRCY